MGTAHLLFLSQGTFGAAYFTACQELNSAGNKVAAALQSLTGRKFNQGHAQIYINYWIPRA